MDHVKSAEPIEAHGTKRKRQNPKRASNEDNITWTASTCLRLLRPIESRVQLLVKRLEQRQREVAANVTAHYKVVCGDSKAELPQSDLDWIVSNTGKTRKVYTSRARNTQHEHRSNQPAIPIELPTPFKAVPGNDYLSAEKYDNIIRQAQEAYDNYPQLMANYNALPRKPARTTKQKVSASNRDQELEEGLIGSFENFLQRTQDRSVPVEYVEHANRGASSLFSMCLRKVPERIEHERDELLQFDEDDKTDVASLVYDDLETMSSTGQGWRPLRQVVRAHGVKLVRSLLTKTAINRKAGSRIVQTAFFDATQSEAEDLMVAYIRGFRLSTPTSSAKKFLFGKSSDTGLDHILDINYHFPGPWTRIVSQSITNGSVPVQYLGVPEVVDCIQRCVRLLTNEDHRSTILDFFKTAILAICDLPANIEAIYEESTQRAYDSIRNLLIVLTTIATISLGQAGPDHAQTGEAIQSMIQSLATDITSSLPDDDPQEPSLNIRAQKLHAQVLLSSLTLAPTSTTPYAPTAIEICTTLTTQTTLHPSILKDLSAHLPALSLCHAQNDPHTALTHLQSQITHLLVLSSSPDIDKDISLVDLIHTLAVSSSSSFAKTVRTKESRKYAWDTEAALTDGDDLALEVIRSVVKPVREQVVLSEWIRETPMPERFTAPDYGDSGSMDGNEIEDGEGDSGFVDGFPFNDKVEVEREGMSSPIEERRRKIEVEDSSEMGGKRGRKRLALSPLRDGSEEVSLPSEASVQDEEVDELALPLAINTEAPVKARRVSEYIPLAPEEGESEDELNF